MTMQKLAFALTIAWVGSVALPAHAETVLRSSISHGVANCRGPRVSDEAALHRSAMGVRNSGDKAVWITCDFDQGPNWPNYESVVGISSVTVAFLNPSREDALIKCTLVDGILHVGTYFSKQEVAQGFPDNYAAVPTWTAQDDNDGKLFAAPAVTCLLPKDVEISYVLVRYYEETGQ